MSLTQIIKEETVVQTKTEVRDERKPQYKLGGKNKYSLFSEQYLEKPVVSGDYKMWLSPTACTIKGIPVIDDF